VRRVGTAGIVESERTLAASREKTARPMVAKSSDWFTEGFDTKDLQEAKTLLEELN
jgi:hypothetical protein